jgi:hypothetical protein
MSDDETQFLALVEKAPLTPDEKEELRRLAESGVDEALWRKLDDLIVASVRMRRTVLKEYRESLDVEVERVTARHEEQLRLVDARMKQDLEAAGDDDDARDRLWDEYYRTVHEMQERLLDEMRRTSSELLQKAVHQVSRGGTA